MNRPSSPWLTGSVSDRFDDRPDADDEFTDVEDYDAYADDEHDDYDDFDGYADDRDDRRWLWVASVAGIVLLIAVAGTMMILSGGDSGTTSATVSPSTSRAPPYPSALQQGTVGDRTAARDHHKRDADADADRRAAQCHPRADTSRAAAVAPSGTVTYTVTGGRQLFDLVTIIYTDQQGALQTDVNVALPWTKQVTLDPGVSLTSVTATSVGGQLNCSITDGAGQTLVAQNNNTMIANCTR